MPAHPGPGREEIDQPQGVFMDTPLKIAVDKAPRLLDGFAEEDEEKFPRGDRIGRSAGGYDYASVFRDHAAGRRNHAPRYRYS